jgi:hypothetical protein
MGGAIVNGGHAVARSLPPAAIYPPPISRSHRDRRPQTAAAYGGRAPDRSIGSPRVDRRALGLEGPLGMGRWLLYKASLRTCALGGGALETQASRLGVDSGPLAAGLKARDARNARRRQRPPNAPADSKMRLSIKT